jgi:type I restriction enzyme S subunit
MANRGDIKFDEVQPVLKKNWLKLGFEETLDKTGSFTKLKSKEYFDEGEYPVIDQGDSFVSGYVNDEKLLYKGRLPVIIFGDHTRVVKYIDFEFATGADGTKVLKPLKIFNNMFYYYYLKSLKVPSLGYSRHFKILKQVDVPLPPLKEQQRIVAKLDTLFTHLEVLNTRLETIPQLLKNFKQAVLKQAVTGKLTEEWRVGRTLGEINLKGLENERKKLKEKLAFERGRKTYNHKNAVLPDIESRTKGLFELFHLPDSWSWVAMDQIVYNVSDGPHFSPKYVSSDVGKRFISMRNVSFNNLDFSKCKYVSFLDHNEFVKRGKPENGDILYTKGGTTGIPCIVSDDIDFSYWVHVALLKPIKRYINSRYLTNALASSLCHNQSQALTHGVGNQDLGLTRMIYISLPLPSKEEQTEIVKRVEGLFAKADKIEEQYKILKEKTDSLPKAILAKAFKGGLVEQLPTDGDAKELLEEIKALKSEVVGNVKTRRNK